MRIFKLIRYKIIITLIEHQVLVTNLQGNVWQQQERINYQILGVKEGVRLIKGLYELHNVC